MNYGTIVEVIFRSTWNNLYKVYNVQRLMIGTVAGVTDAQSITDLKLWANNVIAQQDDIQTNLIKYQDNLLNEVYPTPRFIGTLAKVSTTGSLTSDTLPIGCVMNGCCLTGHNRQRSMKYFAGISKAHVEGGVLTAAAIAQLTECLALYTNAFTTSSHYYVPGCWSVKYSEFNAFTGYIYDNLPSYFRRRKPRE
jgi:hypothetical protein